MNKTDSRKEKIESLLRIGLGLEDEDAKVAGNIAMMWLKQELKRMGKALRMKKDKSYKNPNRLQTALNMRAFGYNQAVRENNQKIDSYLKEGEGK